MKIVKIASAAAIIFLFIFFLHLPAVEKTRKEPVRFGIFPYRSPKTLVMFFSPAARQISENLNRRVKIVTADNYKTFMTRANAGHYDIMLVCTVCLFRLKSIQQYKVIARGSPNFHGGILVRKDSCIRELKHLKDKKIGAVGKFSYGGYLFARHNLRKAGLYSPRDLHYVFLKKTDSIVYSLLGRQTDAGILRIDSLSDEKFDKARKYLHIILRSPSIPQFPLLVKRNLGIKKIKSITKIFTSFHKGKTSDKIVLKSMGINKFIQSSLIDYDFFKKIYYKSSQ